MESDMKQVRDLEQDKARARGARLRRVVIENVRPGVDGGSFPIKRTVGEVVQVSADVHTDGHDVLTAEILHRRGSQAEWQTLELRLIGNDRWTGEFRISTQEPHFYSVRAWPDAFRTWVRDLQKRQDAGQDLALEFLIGAEIVAAAAARASGADAQTLRDAAERLKDSKAKQEERFELAEGKQLLELMARYPDRSTATRYEKELRVEVDRERARFSAWYEMFPRSCTETPTGHGTFKDCIKRLDYVAGMGFDVLYLPPIHPIGEMGRKGKNNSTSPTPEDTGSPWAIGSRLGGHKAIHPQLGTLEDFRELVSKAAEKGIEVALDLAFQCAPDHPYVREHKEWFRIRPDGSVQYAENPAKKYQDIYTLDRKSTRLNSSHPSISYAVLCLKKKNTIYTDSNAS